MLVEMYLVTPPLIFANICHPGKDENTFQLNAIFTTVVQQHVVSGTVVEDFFESTEFPWINILA